MILGFLGAGNMGEALARGAMAGGVVKAEDILIYDVNMERASILSVQLGAEAVSTAVELVLRSQRVVFAVKPQNMPDLLDDLSSSMDIQRTMRDRLFISICAGTTLATIERGLLGLPSDATILDTARPRVMRVMPNTPALIGAGAAAVASGRNATKDDIAFTLNFLRSVGTAEVVDEFLLDAVTALSGSGPAYVYLLIEALQAAGVQQGLSPEVSRRLTLQTVYGAARMALENADVDTAELRRRVTSPGGTTAAGLVVLAERGFTGMIAACVDAATRRGRELAAGKK